MKSACVFAILLAYVAVAQTNPVPLTNNPLVPTSVAPGGPGFTLTVNGTGFISGATVDWDGSPLATTFVSGSRLTATVPAANIANASTASITVVNPAPGTRTSNVIYLTVTSPRTTLSFSEETVLSSSTQALAIADFNRDGRSDLAFANANPSSIDILLGNGDGTFQSARSFSTGSYPSYIATGDFNNDGFVDLAVVIVNSFSVSILLGNGDGSFQSPLSVSLTYEPTSLAVGDFNRDGNLDLAVSNYNSSQTPILLGKGDGTFQPPVNAVSVTANLIITGDFNADGKLDLATTPVGGSQIFVLLGNGDGTFQSPQFYSTGISAETLIAADINGDGILDLATANYNDALGGDVSVLLGNGDGTFNAMQTYNTAGTAAWGLTVGDFNGDGKVDFAVTTTLPNSLGLYSTSLLFGNGDGTFQAHVDYPGYFGSVVGGDFNNDGMVDMANIVNTVLLQDNGTVVTLSPAQLRFPTQMVGAVSQPQAVLVTNGGSSAVVISSVTTTTNYGKSGASNDFEQLNNCPSQLQPAASCTVNVYFTPEQQGSLSGYLAIFDSGGGSPQVANLSGAATVVQISPKSLNFGQQQVGTSSSAKNIRVTNRGGKTITIAGITITGVDAGDYAEVNACGSTLGPGASCSIAVVFTPTQTGTRIAAVSISDTGGGSPQRVSLSGIGI